MDAPALSSLSVVAAGDTWRYTRSLTDYPASAGYTLAARIVSSTGGHAATVAQEGDAFVVTFAASQTALIAPGLYQLVEAVSFGEDRAVVGRYGLQVTPDPFSGQTEQRSRFQRALDRAREHLAAYAESGVWRATEVQTADRTTKCATPDDLRKLIRTLEAEVARERREAAGLPPRAGIESVGISFGGQL